MKRLIRRAAFVAFLCLTVTAPRAGVAKVLVFAASSTTNVIEDLNRLFAERGKGRALGSFGSSGIMARQIENGAPADIYLTADVKWINYLVGKALVTAGSKNDLFHNRLALIAPARRPFRLRIRYGFALYDRLGDSPLAIADPQHSPAGRYARMALETLGVWKPLTKRTARTNNVREALALVERGEAAAGIVMAAVLPFWGWGWSSPVISVNFLAT